MPLTGNTIRKILLIDDDQDELDLMQSALHQIDGAIQVFYADKCDPVYLSTLPTPDLIFLDINMPEHSGFDWLKGIREKVPYPIPVIMYSTTRSQEFVAKSLQLGANLFVTKPNRIADLVILLTQILGYDWTNPALVTEKSFQQGQFHLSPA